MSDTPLLDWTEAASRRDSGMTRAVEHADAVISEWSAWAERLLADYVEECSQFMAEDVRAYARDRGLPDPPDGRSWGAVLQRAAKAGHIVKVGYAPAKSSNCSPKCLWGRA